MLGTFNINYRSREPIYQQIYNEVVREIALGLLSPDEKMATVRELASNLGINPNTVSKAYQLLEQSGYIYSAVGKGSFVSTRTDMVSGLREKALNDVEKALNAAHDLGIGYGDIIELTDKIYHGGGDK